MGVLYHCNPAANYMCGKTNCHINGGPCTMTANKEFATDPDKIVLVLPADENVLRDTPGTRKARRKHVRK